jgi:putative ABC transport system permease protein
LIVGVVADVRDVGLLHDLEPIVYVPIAQVSDPMNAFQNQALPLQWVVRTEADPRRLRPAIERELAASSGALPIGRVRTMDEIVALSTARTTLSATLLTMFSTIALALACAGLYGVMVQSIQERTREIGIRMALGAEPWAVRGMVVMEGLRLTGTGVALGTVGTFVLTQVMAGAVYGIATWDPLVFVTVAAVLSAVGLVAVLLSARRATAVQPTEALRQG